MVIKGFLIRGSERISISSLSPRALHSCLVASISLLVVNVGIEAIDMVASNHHLSVSWWFRLNLVGSVSAVISTGSADQWDDFTNNFATDLAPIIVLFGEQVTKQFLSESTGLLDNIIFGVAPLGILTAVVSVIRVYGNASLKAFIGRAQEAHGQAEAELCSSTSNDVCELWSNGGICRVFGRPWILEFCYTGSKTLFYPIFDDRDGVNLRPGVSGIYLPKDALCGSQDGKVHAEKDDLVSSDDSVNLSAWSEINSKLKSKMDSGTGFEGVSIRIAASAEEGRTMQFAPHPNLSLNIGIKSVGKPLSFLMAVIGMLLQSGFFSYSTWITFYYPQLYNNSEPPHLWSFVLATAGTAMLVVGMTLSARIIEMRSIERSFEERVHNAVRHLNEIYFDKIPLPISTSLINTAQRKGVDYYYVLAAAGWATYRRSAF
jgi:hypothetical protein